MLHNVFYEAIAWLNKKATVYLYMEKFWSEKKLADLVNCGLFANILLVNNFFSEIQNYFSN